MFPLVAVLLTIVALFTLCTGCTSFQNIVQPPGTDPVPAATGTAPLITAIVTTAPVMQTQPAGPVRVQPSDTEFLLAIDASQAKILDNINNINTEIAKDGIMGNTSPDYNALGSYARRLVTSADEEITAISKFREIADAANESRKDYYLNYLTQLKPFGASLETGAALAQKKEYIAASGFFSNAKNDLSLVRSQELPGHLKITTQIMENFGPFMVVIQKQATYTAPK